MLDTFSDLRQKLKRQQHRALLILSGTRDWQRSKLPEPEPDGETWLWLGKEVPEGLRSHVISLREAELKHWLGQEADLVFIDSRDGFSANGLGILAGLIRAGGLMVLLMPPKTQWKQTTNPANRRFLNTPFRAEDALPYFTEHLQKVFKEQAIWLDQEEGLFSDPLTANQPATPARLELPTADQKKALMQIHSVAFGHRKRPLLIRADRGRGKSSVLGLAAVQLLQQGKQQIVLTAARYDQAAIAFAMAENQIDPAHIEESKPGRLSFYHQDQLKTLQFRAPDDLIQNPAQTDLLMVDEAAHLPNPMLKALLSHYHRMVFATTLHGYEGCGRGFELRFTQTLNRLTPEWKSIHLAQPIRWAEQDPLEKAINQALLLDAEAPELIEADLIEPSDIKYQATDAQTLMHTPALLKPLFGLLVQAHYQTSPDDLQQLLSAPNLKIWKAEWQGKAIGVALCIEEGGLETHLIKNASLHGHLVPQLLERFYGTHNLLSLRSWRIMRIAIHPEIQGRGIGTQLLKTIQKDARSNQIDFLSSSFGATRRLAAFWLNQGFQPLHLGQKRDKASGTFNLVVAQSLNEKTGEKLNSIGRAFSQQLPHTVLETAHELDASLLLRLSSQLDFNPENAATSDCVLNDYIHSRRPYEAISGSLWQWSYQNAQKLLALKEPQQTFWVDKVMKKRDWQTVANTHRLPGRKGVEKTLKAILSRLIG